METLKKGNYLGTKTHTLVHNRIIVSKTEYCTVESKDWHCHENSFFAYFLKGGNYEYRKDKEIKCEPGTLLFYKAMEPHCNKNYATGSKIFHVEIDNGWFYENELETRKVDADKIDQLKAKNIFTHIVDEFFIRDELSGDSIENLLIYLWNSLSRTQSIMKAPLWVQRFNNIKLDLSEKKITLVEVARELNIHPVTLSKEFPEYYHSSFGDYMRQLRIEKSLSLLSKKNISINEIAFSCGFSDTSNYIRSFRKVKGITPNAYRKMI
jgi:AraC-like DNA-binding protein